MKKPRGLYRPRAEVRGADGRVSVYTLTLPREMGDLVADRVFAPEFVDEGILYRPVDVPADGADPPAWVNNGY